MKHKFLITALAMVVLFGCAQQEEVTLQKGNDTTTLEIVNELKVHKSNSLEVTADDVAFAVRNLNLDGVSTKKLSSRAGFSSKNYTVEPVEINGQIRFYVVNFANNEGYVVLSASRAVNPVLAFAEEGNFDTNGDKPDGLLSWMYSLDSYTKAREAMPTDSLFDSMDEWRTLLNEVPEQLAQQPQRAKANENIYTRGKRLIREAVDEAILARDAEAIYYPEEQFCDDYAICSSVWDIAKDMVYVDFQESWRDYVFIAKRKASQTSNRVDNMLPTKWGQQSGFNKFFPLNSDGEHQKAGCAPVAAAQLMYYHKTPPQYQWNQMSLTEPDEYNARLIRDLAIKMKTDSVGGTDENNIPLGFTDSFWIRYFQSNTLNMNVLNSLKSTGPVYLILCAVDKFNPLKTVGHACLATGGMVIKRDWEYDLYFIDDPYSEEASYEKMHEENIINAPHFYINWGWYGRDNGFYYDLKVDGYSFWINDMFYVRPYQNIIL